MIVVKLTPALLDFEGERRYNNIKLTKGMIYMAKLSITYDQGNTAVKCRLSRDETVNGKELDFLASCPTQFFMRPRMDGNKTIILTGADGIPMASALKTKINKDRYFLIVAQLVEMLSSAQQYNLDLNKLILDPKFMLMNKQTGQIFIPYMTISNCETPNGGIIRCLREVSTLARFTTDYDFSFADNFMYFVMGMGRFSLADAEDYIRVNSPKTYNDMVRLPSIQSLQTIQHRSGTVAVPDDGGFSLLRLIFGKAAVPVNYAPKADNNTDDEETDIPVIKPKPKPMPKPQQEISPFAPPRREEQPPQEEEFPDIPQDEEPFEEVPEKPAVTEEKKPEEHVPSDATMELDAALILRPAKITRRATGEVFSINKPVFIIGKENIRVDLCVTDNRTVSRVHAHIVCKDGTFYIIDQNSTNRTFVNGINVPPHVEYKLRDGDEIRLSNEFFDFQAN